MDYYVKYGNTLYFEGYNYPHGTHVMNIEAPLFFVGLRWFCRNIMDISAYNVALINTLMLSGYYICVWVMYRILRRHHLPLGFAVVFSLMITFLSPQIGRLAGHFFLSFTCAFPLMWYVIIRLFEGKKVFMWAFLFFVIMFVFSFTHLYYFLIGGAFLVAHIGVHFLQNIRKIKSFLLIYFAALIALFSPVAILQIWLKLTLTGVQDGVKYPFGFLYYVADFRTIFFPFYEHEKNIWRIFEFLLPYKLLGIKYLYPPNWEGMGFVGLLGFCFLFFFVYRIGKYIWKKRLRFALRPILPAPAQVAIWAAVFVLLFSMGYPLNFLDNAEDKVGLLRQFRSLGRLSWAFYYVYMTVCVYYLYAFFRFMAIHWQEKRQKLRYIMLFSVVIITGLESVWVWKNSLDYMKTGNISHHYRFWQEDIKLLLEKNGHKTTEFQAMMVLPFFHIGSEKFAMEGTWHAQMYGYITSRFTGLPMVNNYSSRTPLTASCANVQLVSPAYIEKKLISTLPDKRPFLLLYSHEIDQMSEGQKRLITKSKPICKLNEMTFATLDLSAFEDVQDSVIVQYQLLKKENKLISSEKMQTSAPSTAVSMYNFGDEAWAKDSIQHFGFWRQRGAGNIIETSPIVAKDSTEMEVSFWVKVDANSNYFPYIHLLQYEGEKVVLGRDWDPRFQIAIYKDWARVQMYFPLLKSGNRVVLKVEGGKNFYADNVLLRPKDIDVYTHLESDSVFVLNNYPIGF